ncbi:Endoglucanase-7 [Colletotrichum chlorophyti]|uniref:lytic cellulose monooxygenase (C4-dehydrogenating) n=1 Tax=Colletotrichum chlorophyti TaxID=708187 RepID=A0A1Q8RQX4_9PEZI|nr:Endoglucanase-7 [Colletotrichum chlorophyti]
MSSVKYTLALVGAFAASALAHGTVTGYKIDGAYVEGYKLDNYYLKKNGGTPPAIAAWSAENLDNGFVDGTSYDKPDIICHKNAAPGEKSVKVAAGSKVDFLWSAWPESHVGPVLTYAAKVDGDFSAIDKETLKWVKIDEAGIDYATQEWAATKLIKNNNTWTSTVPETLAPGNYVLRHEIIAMHGAGALNGAQNYPQCINVEITGSGTENPEGVLGTALYKNTDAGIKFNMKPYTTIESYVIPGPKLYGPGSGSGSGSTPISNSTTPVTAPSATPTTTLPTAAAEPEDGCASKKTRRAARRHARSFRV